jgi:hypothetical protein
MLRRCSCWALATAHAKKPQHHTVDKSWFGARAFITKSPPFARCQGVACAGCLRRPRLTAAAAIVRLSCSGTHLGSVVGVCCSCSTECVPDGHAGLTGLLLTQQLGAVGRQDAGQHLAIQWRHSTPQQGEVWGGDPEARTLSLVPAKSWSSCCLRASRG